MVKQLHSSAKECLQLYIARYRYLGSYSCLGNCSPTTLDSVWVLRLKELDVMLLALIGGLVCTLNYEFPIKESLVD